MTVYAVYSPEGFGKDTLHWTIRVDETDAPPEFCEELARYECGRQQERGWPASYIMVHTGMEHDFAPDFDWPMCFDCGAPTYPHSEHAKLPCPDGGTAVRLEK
jgi:hypothetical protein